MKIVKAISIIAFGIGFLLILGAAGASDMANELGHMHSIDFRQILLGFALMLPSVAVNR